MASITYNSFKASRLDGSAPDLTGDTIKIMLVTSSYTPLATHEFRSSVTNEVVGSGYTAGGQTLASKTITGTTTPVFDAADVTWSSSTITARGAVLYQDTGNAATDRLIHYIDFGTDQISSSGNFTIQWNASGIFSLT